MLELFWQRKVAFFEIISRVADGKVYIYILAICHMVISPDFGEENTAVLRVTIRNFISYA
jgi:hypothetical protein